MRINVKNKRGIRIQTRIILSALLLLAQFVFLFYVLFSFSSGSKKIYWASEVLAILTVIYIVNRRGNPSYKIAWIVFILIFPIFGISVFLLFGGGRVLPYFRKRMIECEKKYMSLIKEGEDVHEKLRYHDLIHSRQAEYLVNEAEYPLYSDTEVEYLSPGEIFLPRFLEELCKAEKYIFIEFFIIAEGEMWNSIHEILREKVKDGVEVRVLFDDFGSIKRQRKDFITRLKKDGIKVAVFNKIGPSINIFMNNRNHRKIVVIDGKIAATGGLNLADEYINKAERFGYWLDSAVFVKGEAVKSFVAMFCSMWEFTTGKETYMHDYLAENPIQNNAFALPYCDDPLDDINPAEGIYMQILNTAQKYVYITSPYLIIDSSMISILGMAAKAGVDVRIITPGIGDKWYVHPVTQYNYTELLEAGVRIYEYTPGFIHSKTFVSDDAVATVGTVNMDYRSFILHFECGVWFSNTETIKDIRKHFEDILKDCKEIKLEEWKKESILRKFKRYILHLFAPFL